jgi:hypothetical protein
MNSKLCVLLLAQVLVFTTSSTPTPTDPTPNANDVDPANPCLAQCKGKYTLIADHCKDTTTPNPINGKRFTCTCDFNFKDLTACSTCLAGQKAGGTGYYEYFREQGGRFKEVVEFCSKQKK